MGKLVSVIVPVYNKEKSLERCIESALGQLGDEDELVLVDDGSTDGSARMCREAAGAHENVICISQENAGVSAARNAGVSAASGAYLLFLDADDELGPGTVEALVRAFESFGDEVDVVTYPILYVKRDGSSHGHRRERWFTQTGVYALGEFSQIAQTTMNIVVRNRGLENLFFETGRAMGEDQLYITHSLERTGKIGFCAEALYLYSRDGSGNSYALNSPLFTFEEYLGLVECYLQIAKRTPALRDYALNLVLYNIGWRTRQNKLLPEFGSPDQRAANLERLASLLRKVPLRLWLDSVYIRAMHKPYLISTFGLASGAPALSFTRKRTVLAYGPDVWKTSLPSIRVMRMICEGGNLHLSCRVFSAAFWYASDVKVFVCLAGKRREVRLRDSSFSYYMSHKKTARAFVFDLDVPVPKKGAHESVELAVVVDGQEAPSVRFAVKPKRCNLLALDEGLSWATRDFRIAFAPGQSAFELTGTRFLSDGAFFKSVSDDTRQAEARHRVRKDVKRGSGRPVWLYVDAAAADGTGPAFAQFRHDISQADGAARWYVTSRPDALMRESPGLSGSLTSPDDAAYLALYLASRVIVSGADDPLCWMPSDADGLAALADLAAPKSVVHVRDGVRNEHAPWKLGKDKSVFDYEAVLTTEEAEAAVAEYDCARDEVLCAGLSLAPSAGASVPGESENPAGRVLVALDWRSYLIRAEGEAYVPTSNGLMGTAYGRGIAALVEALARAGIKADVLLHPNLACYEAELAASLPGTGVATEISEARCCGVVVTDFCARAYEHALAGAALVGFVPDPDELRSDLNFCDGADFAVPEPHREVDEVVSGVKRALTDPPAQPSAGADAAERAQSLYRTLARL